MANMKTAVTAVLLLALVACAMAEQPQQLGLPRRLSAADGTIVGFPKNHCRIAAARDTVADCGKLMGACCNNKDKLCFRIVKSNSCAKEDRLACCHV